MNTNLLKFIAFNAVALLGCLGLSWTSQSMQADKATQKIKDKNWRAVLEEIEESLEAATPSVKGSVLGVRDRLKSFLILYGRSNASQAEYFEGYIQRLEGLSGNDYTYRQRIKQIRIIINDLKKPIEDF